MDLLATLQDKYKSIPNELKALKRWVGYKIETSEDGRTSKYPYNALSGKRAKSNDKLTWTTYNVALNGCVKYKFNGLGFMLGDGIFGVDLDNHADKDGNIAMTDEEFQAFSEEFITALDSYAEYSQSGKGIHIICAGKLPEGGRRKGCVEMYDSGRFFACTGNVIHDTKINERSEEIKPLWEKYVKSTYNADNNIVKREFVTTALTLSDDDLIDKAFASSTGNKFYSYYHDGDISMDGNDHSAADLSFCNMLAFWSNCDKAQMDRIFRNSALMRDKWDEYRGGYTYGEKTLLKAINGCSTVYTGERLNSVGDTRGMAFTPEKNFTIRSINEIQPIKNDGMLMNIDEDGEPIFNIKKIFTPFQLTDTGNAQKFYAYFGDLFKYNTTDKCFMFWTGKVWRRDGEDVIIRKYADKLIEICHNECKDLEQQIIEEQRNQNDAKCAQLTALLAEMTKNTKKIANKSGKDAMLSELKHIGKMAIESSEFDKDVYLLNTESGVVDLKTGEILPQNIAKEQYISKSTKIEVSYEEPTEWLKFLRSVFLPKDGNMVDAEECLEAVQTYLGYSLSGLTKEQIFFILYGIGSNGKSTLTETIAKIMGDYAATIPSSTLMAQKNSSSASIEYTLARLRGVRFLETGETDNGCKLAEAQMKLLTGGDKIQAQFKFGQPFEFYPNFKIWMTTNNLPQITGVDDGIWRRPKTLPFVNSFKGDNKDKFLPEKLENEKEKILGWCIQGFKKYWTTLNSKGENCNFAKCEVFEKDILNYKNSQDIVAQFIDSECKKTATTKTNAKEIWNAFKVWAKDNNYWVGKETEFRKKMEINGIYTEYVSETRMYVGIRLNGVHIGGDRL